MKVLSGLLLLGLAHVGFAQYTGPAILSRGEAPATTKTPRISFRPYAQVFGVYDSGLSGVAVDSQGELANTSSTGAALIWGVSGAHSWKRATVGLEYRGALNHYFRRSFFDSTNQTLQLSASYQLSRHSSFSLRQSAGTFSRDFGLQNLRQSIDFDPGSTDVPTTDFFDNRTTYYTSAAALSYQKTARLSFNFAGGATVIRRRSNALSGVTGTFAQGDAHYRVSRRSTIGGVYQFNRYTFSRGLGDTNVNGMMFSYSRALSPRVELTGFGGVQHSETKYVQTFGVDPVIGALLGITSSTQIVHNLLWSPSFRARLSRRFATGLLFAQGGRMITPGNGLFLTSTAFSVDAGYMYSGLRRWSFSAAVGQMRSQSRANAVGDYRTTSGQVYASRRLFSMVHFVMSYSARQYDSGAFSRYNRLIHQARIGFGFAPGELPLRVW